MSDDDLTFFDTNIPCLAACPVHTNAGTYVAAIADGDDELAYLTARLPNPFASVCGRVCAAPCEDACRRGLIDEPIAIRALKRFATERYGVESDRPETALKVSAPPAEPRPQRVGVVGGGPGGLAAAHDLARLGYRVTLYEATDRLGGMMWLGIPEYRLDRDLLAGEIQAIVDLGVEVRYDLRLGRDVSLERLRAQHDALFLAFGANLGRGLDIEGHDADGVFRALEFLINMNRGFTVDVGERVLVIGGGDVAMDAARTALRAEAYAEAGGRDRFDEADERASVVAAVDAARTAARAGARSVTVLSLESAAELPAHEFEVHEARKEGIEFVHRRGPARIVVEGGRVVGLETIGVRSVFDAAGRFAPEFDTGDRRTFAADTVILAVGQTVDLDALGTDGAPAISSRRTIEVDPDTGATSIEGIWAGGDAAKGPRTLIDAIADGRRSAADIHRHFGGETQARAPGRMVQLQQFHRLDDTYDRWQRVDPPTIPTGRRIGLAEVESGFTEQQARCEASRCLRCFANILLDVERCVLCALCSDVCPYDLISLVPAEEVGEIAGASPGGTALLLDEDRCIRCALCIERCPTDALSMGMWSGVGVPSMGTWSGVGGPEGVSR
ncbi:MAG TPA: FAD-dependent oxidoreductase [Acidimicrobiales bacterium]|nr:FAD-dependent oxidoreductase [Acidimicrobiales bacterium]